MKSLIRFFASHHLLANLIVFAILALGIVSLINMKRDIYPSVDLDQLLVATRYPGASPEDVELNVTNKLEDEIKTVDGIKTMTSLSMENFSVLDIKLDPASNNKDKVKRDIRDAVNRVNDLPVEVTETPYITEIKSDNMPVIWVGITGKIPYRELRFLAKQFEKKLENIKGVSRLQTTGYLDREVKVEVSLSKSKEYQLPMREIVTAIQMRNIRATGGSFESYTSDKNIVTLEEFGKPQDVGDVIVRSTFEGPRVLVKDLAVIKDSFEPEKTMFHMNGKGVIAFTVIKKGNADIIKLVDRIRELVEKEQLELPEDVEIICSSDYSRFVRTRLDVILDNGFIGLGLVLVVLFIFLNFRTAFWVAMGIPITMLGIFILMPHFNAFLDLVTLIGMVIIVGLIVDDAIVIAENIHSHLEMGKPPLDAAVDGTYNVIKPVFATIITSILAFSPMFFMTGMMGKFIFSIPLVMTLGLLISFFEGIFILPAHIIGQKRKKKLRWKKFGAPSNRFTFFKRKFRKFVFYILTLRYLIIAVFVLLLIGSFWYAGNKMQFILFPGTVSDEFMITIELPTGTSLEATSDKVKEIENLIDKLPETELSSYNTFIGNMPEVVAGENENWALIMVTLTPFSQRERITDEIVEELRSKTDKLTDYTHIRYVNSGGGPPVGRPITIRVNGSDDDVRTALADSLEAFLASYQGVIDIDRDDKLGKEQIALKLDHSKLSQSGLTVADVAHNVRLAYDGEVVTSVRYGDENVGFRVILEEEARRKPGYLSEIMVPNRQGRLIPLGQVAGFSTAPSLSGYNHYDGERSIVVTAGIVTGETTPLIVTQAAIDHFDLKNWPGMRFVVGGEAEETQESMKSLAITMIAAFVGIYFVLVLLFNSLTQPLIVMIAIPFGFIGVISAFTLNNEPLGFMAILGVIGLMGVVVNDALILVNYINEQMRCCAEKKIKFLVAKGTAGRLRPILMTSITTVAGLLPLAYGIGGSDPWIAPMALALGYGILFATPLTLILLPCLYMVRNDFARMYNWIIKKFNIKTNLYQVVVNNLF
ncbi:efflux RND transporter permease subunit [candidate division KSB1 bacterium]